MKAPDTSRSLIERNLFYLYEGPRERNLFYLYEGPRDLQKLHRMNSFYLYEGPRELHNLHRKEFVLPI